MTLPPPPPPARRSSPSGWLGPVVAIVGALLALLTVWSVADPHVQVPVISEVVCSLKGGTWTDGSPAFGVPAGCYGRSG